VLTGRAITDVLRWFKWHQNISELAVQARFEYAGASLGCRHVAFQTRVAAGANAKYVMYAANCAIIEETDLILLNGGLFHQGYAGDIVRCFPAIGRFSSHQTTVYNLVLSKQIALIKLIRPSLAVADFEQAHIAAVTEILKELGIIDRAIDEIEEMVGVFCPHPVFNHIGMNSQDEYPKSELVVERLFNAAHPSVLAPGMVITIGAGIYFNSAVLARIPHSQAINVQRVKELEQFVAGVRIADNVLVTADGCEVLSAGCPKTIPEIEVLMSH
jgi:Xaa-Pro aminopeptidase